MKAKKHAGSSVPLQSTLEATGPFPLNPLSKTNNPAGRPAGVTRDGIPFELEDVAGTMPSPYEHQRCNVAGCRSWPTWGEVKCFRHGGGLTFTWRIAQQRIKEISSAALARLESIINDPREDGAVVIRAIIAVLDRAGLKPVDKFEFRGTVGVLTPAGLRALPEDQLAQAISVARMLVQASKPEVEDDNGDPVGPSPIEPVTG